MDRKTIVSLVAVVVIVVGGAFAYVLTSTQSKVATKDSHTSTDEHKATKTSLSALLEKGEPRKCTYDGTNEDSQYSGTAYFSSKKQMRNDYKSVADGKARNGSMIITDGTQYFWNTETKQGFKTAVQASDSEQSSQNESVDTKATFSFHCETWKVDESKFTPPSDVAIQDLTQLMQNLPTTGQ